MKKKLFALLLSLCLVAGQATPAAAASYLSPAASARTGTDTLLSSDSSDAAGSALSAEPGSDVPGAETPNSSDAGTQDGIGGESGQADCGSEQAGTGSEGSGESGQAGSGSEGSGESGQTGTGSEGSGESGQTGTGSEGSGETGQTGTGSEGSGESGQTGDSSEGSGESGQAGSGSEGSSESGQTGTGTETSGEAGQAGEGTEPSGESGQTGDGSEGSGESGQTGDGSEGSGESGQTGDATPPEATPAEGETDGTDAKTEEEAVTDPEAETPEEEDIPLEPALSSEAAATDHRFSSAAPASGKTYLLLCAYNQSRTVDLGKAVMSNDTNVRIFRNNNYYRQYFTLKKNSDGTWTILNYRSSKVVSVSGSAAATANVVQKEDRQLATQRWIPRLNADGSYSFLSAADRTLALEVKDGKFADYTTIRLQKDENVKAEHFLLQEVTLPDYTGTIMLRPESSPKMALGPKLGKTTDGNTVALADAEGLSWQKYKLTHVWGGYYTITNAKTGLALALPGGKWNSGTQVIQTARTGEDAQLWKPWSVSDGVLRFTSRLHSARVLGVKFSSGSYDYAVSRGYSESNKNQRFLTASYTSDRTVSSFTIRSCLDTDRVVEPISSSTANNVMYLSRDWAGSNRQYFKLMPAIARGKRDYYYRLVNATTGKLLVVKGNSATAGTPVVTGSWTGAKGQLWHPVINSDGSYRLVSCLNSSLALELKGGSTSYDARLQVGTYASTDRFKWQLTSMKITSAKVSSSDRNTAVITASGTPMKSDDGKLYLFAVDGYVTKVKGVTPIASAASANSVTFSVPVNLNKAGSVIQKRFYLGVLRKNKYLIASNGFYITNPQSAAARKTKFPAAASKKGLKLTITHADFAESLNCSHAVLDFPIETYLNGSDFAYNYAGKTYYFSSAVRSHKNLLKQFYDRGIVVTGIFYLSSRMTDYIQPSAAASSGRGVIYALNTKNENRHRLEALFSCLAEEWTKDGIYVANWVYGNESDQYRTYNFTGGVSYNQYHESFAEGFRLFNTAIKSRWKNARTYVSLDHNWNLPENSVPSGTCNGQQLLADFNTDLIRQGKIHWDMCMHPYPSPEQDCKIWIRSPFVTDSGSSPQITPLNAAAFAASLKATYGSSVHVILPETGISSIYNGKSQLYEQAAAVALAYYLTEFSDSLDMIGIHREMDSTAEMAGGWHLGLYYYTSNYCTRPKLSATVFKYMDTTAWKKYTKNYLKYVTKDGTAITSWGNIVPGFSGSRFTKTAS